MDYGDEVYIVRRKPTSCTTVALILLVVAGVLISIPMAIMSLAHEGMSVLNESQPVKSFAVSFVQPWSNVIIIILAVLTGCATALTLFRGRAAGKSWIAYLVMAGISSALVLAQVVVLNIWPFTTEEAVWNSSPLYVVGGLLIMANYFGVIVGLTISILLAAQRGTRGIGYLLLVLGFLLVVASYAFAIDPPVNYAWSLAGAYGWIYLGVVSVWQARPQKQRLREQSNS